MSNRAAWAEIDLKALEHNYKAIRAHIAPSVKLCAVVKANAYGHGAAAAARVALANGADYLAVATISEGIELRAAGFTAPILVLGLVLPESAADVVSYDLTQVVCDLELARALSAAALAAGRTVKIHLKVDTGMGRIGVRASEIGALAEQISMLPSIEIEGMFSHFAAADSTDKSYTREQLALFDQAIAAVEARGIKLAIRHIAESAAILEIPEAHYDMVRAGVIQYGLMPSDEVERTIELQPVMALKAKVVWLKHIKKGESIGYGRDFIAARDSVIATLPLGYADGYIRAYGRAHGAVEIGGSRAPIAGRVCMDQVMIDVTDIPDVKIGDVATLFGGDITIDEAAEWLGTINYEVPCMIAPRIPRVYVD